MNFWYAERHEEMFLDLDSRRAFRRAVSVLVVAIRKRLLLVRNVYVYRTRQAGHYHMIVVLGEILPWETKLAWELWMGNDRLRLAYVLARRNDWRVCGPEVFCGCRGSLLATPTEYYRAADAWCRCKGKHKEDKATRRCGAMKRLLGEARSADYFARTGERRVRPLLVRVPPGEVLVSQLKKWSKAK